MSRFLSDLGGRGFSKWKADGTVTFRNPGPVSNAPAPRTPEVPALPTCAKCGSKEALVYRCAPGLGCVHTVGWHRDCSKCGDMTFKSDSP